MDLTSTWHEEELEPYAKLNRAGLIDIVMSGHLAHARHSLSAVSYTHLDVYKRQMPM